MDFVVNILNLRLNIFLLYNSIVFLLYFWAYKRNKTQYNRVKCQYLALRKKYASV